MARAVSEVAGPEPGSPKTEAATFLKSCQASLSSPASAPNRSWRFLAQRRAEIAASEISKNPRGQILEPGFRVIFPVQATTPAPGALSLGPTASRIEKEFTAGPAPANIGGDDT